jgi:hypothetical protein
VEDLKREGRMKRERRMKREGRMKRALFAEGDNPLKA